MLLAPSAVKGAVPAAVTVADEILIIATVSNDFTFIMLPFLEFTFMTEISPVQNIIWPATGN